MKLSALQVVYLTLAVVGLLVTWTFNVMFFIETGSTSALAFFAAGYTNHAATSLTNDLLVGVVAFLVWSFVEARRLALPRWWIWPVLTLAIAFALAFPLFLFVRDRAEARRHGP